MAHPNGYGEVVTDSADVVSAGIDGFTKGPITVHAYGNWDTASLQMQASPDGTTWYDVGSAHTANGFENIVIAGWAIRAVITSSGAGTSITVRIFHRHQVEG